MSEMEEEVFDGDVFDGEPDPDVPRAVDGKQDDMQEVDDGTA